MGHFTALAVKSASNPGRCRGGEMLYFNVGLSGSKSLVQRVMVDGKRYDIGLSADIHLAR